MDIKDPGTLTTFSYLQNFFYAIFLAVFGGLIKFLRSKVLSEDPVNWSRFRTWLELFIELATSGFVGVLAFHGCQAMELSPMWTACIVGVSGHEGARAIAALVKIVEKKINSNLEQ